jgi:hypothetical protein
VITSETIRFLFDPLTGGPPRAFECKLDTEEWGLNGKVKEDACGAVTRTLSGMRAHQRIVHGFVPQSKLFSREGKDHASSHVDTTTT